MSGLKRFSVSMPQDLYDEIERRAVRMEYDNVNDYLKFLAKRDLNVRGLHVRGENGPVPESIELPPLETESPSTPHPLVAKKAESLGQALGNPPQPHDANLQTPRTPRRKGSSAA